MPDLKVGDTTIEVNEDGFIVDPDRWNEEIAAALAATEGVGELTPDHWRVARYLREHYLEFGLAPMIRKLCKATGLSPHSVDYSGGIWGNREKLPPDDILEMTTMCGHAMVASNLVKSLVDDIKAGKKSAEDAGKELARLCECGIFNPSRAAELLSGMASK